MTMITNSSSVPGFIGEGHREDAPRRHPSGGDKMSDAHGQHARFAAARTRKNEKRSLAMGIL
jgi:hypothetical protein